MCNLTQDELKKHLKYIPETGEFIRISTGERLKTLVKGYNIITVNNKTYRAGRLAFIYMEGSISDDCEVDHANLIRDDDSWDNLRKVTKSQNQQNKGVSANNSSGIKGLVFRDIKYPCWAAKIKYKGKAYQKTFMITTYGSVEAAKIVAVAWLAAMRNKLHGEFANHG